MGEANDNQPAIEVLDCLRTDGIDRAVLIPDRVLEECQATAMSLATYWAGGSVEAHVSILSALLRIHAGYLAGVVAGELSEQ